MEDEEDKRQEYLRLRFSAFSVMTVLRLRGISVKRGGIGQPVGSSGSLLLGR